MRLHRPHILIIIEPRISGHEADEVYRRIAKQSWVRSEARGFSEGLWILWDCHDVDLIILHADQHFIHVEVLDQDGVHWELTAVYASPKKQLRPQIWEQIGSIAQKYPWCLIGDFNCTLNEGE